MACGSVGATGDGAGADVAAMRGAATGDPVTVLAQAVSTTAAAKTTNASAAYLKRTTPARRIAGRESVRTRGILSADTQTAALSSRSSRLRVFAGSTGMPGPMVVVKTTFLRYRPLAADGLARSTSSSAAV